MRVSIYAAMNTKYLKTYWLKTSLFPISVPMCQEHKKESAGQLRPVVLAPFTLSSLHWKVEKVHSHVWSPCTPSCVLFLTIWENWASSQNGGHLDLLHDIWPPKGSVPT